MEDKLEEILKQYPFQVYTRQRTRGAFLIGTERGVLLLKETGDSLAHIDFEERVKQFLVNQGYDRTDLACLNQKGEFLCRDRYHNYWILRHWSEGVECDMKSSENILRGASHLGRLHQMMRFPQLSGEGYRQKESVSQLMERHNKELKRVRSYIRGKKRKNEMEICLLNSFDVYYDQACLARTILQECGYEKLWEDTLNQGRLVHGSYTYHHILLEKDGIFTSNFNRMEIGIQVRDLYDYLRKVMEKNGWSKKLGLSLVDAYQRERSLDVSEKTVLYALLLYPEKYWKLVDFYYNSNKSWMSEKNLEKLLKIREQEESREGFLHQVKRALGIT